MKRVNIADAKAHLSEYMRDVKRGETLIICERNVLVAEVRAYEVGSYRKPVLGSMRGKLWIANDAFDPMSYQEADEWEAPIFPK